ncbi:hypothetical protein ISS08_00165 [Candidatus Pacearchaeota archaeon]|nr:hypothetical protein [Candidatus Pacearchaeota archaeon]
MNKIIAILFVSIFLFSFVGAENIATIDFQGLEFVDSDLMQEFQEEICGEESLNQDSCPLENSYGKIDKIISQENLLLIQNINPEAAKAIELNNQIQEYVSQGTQIFGTLEIDEIGIIRKGMFKEGFKTFEIGNFLNPKLKPEYVQMKGQVEFIFAFAQEDWAPLGKAEIILNKEGDFLEAINSNPCAEINSEEDCVPEKTIFNNLQFNFEGEPIANRFELNENGEITFAKFYVNENGGEYLIGNQIIYAPSSSSIKYERGLNSISIFMGVSSKLDNFQKKINDSLGGAEITIKGSELELPTGEILEGELSYKDNNFFIKSGTKRSLLIDGIKFKSPEKEDLTVFFEGEPSEDFPKSYIAFDSRKDLIVLDSKKEVISNVDLYYSHYNSENLRIKELQNAKIILDTRSSENLIPELKITEKKDSNYDLLIGEIEIYNENGEIKTKIRDNLRIPKSSIRVAIEIDDQEGNSLLGTERSPQKIITNDFNQFLFVPKEISEKDMIGPDFSERLNFDYSGIENVKKNIEKDFGIEITGDGSLYDLKRIRDLLNAATPEMIGGVNKIELLNDDEDLNGFGGVANPYGRKIKILNSELDGATLIHELAHTRTFELFQEPKRIYEEEFQDLRSDYLNNQISEEEFRISRDKLKKKHSSTGKRFNYYLFPEVQFIKEWGNIAGDNYGKNLGKKSSLNPIFKLFNIGVSNEWAVDELNSPLLGGDGNFFGPKNGFIRPYGANNIFEDISTFVEETYKNPAFFTDFLDVNSKDYDPRYLEKLKLLKKYDFISEEAYNNIIN